MVIHRKHIYPEKDLALPRTLHDDRHRLEQVEVPVVTVSASFRQDIAKNLHEHTRKKGEIVFSRAHYSMAVAILDEARRQNLSAWLVDPINFLSADQWQRLVRIELIGQLTARIPILKKIKDIFDTFIRKQVPLKGAIDKPLEYVTTRVEKPIVSVHYESGNFLARHGKKVLQIVTDPHVRPHYLFEAGRPNISFAVFDEATRKSFFAKAAGQNLELAPDKVVVTGPPVDSRIIETRKGKKADSYKKRGLRLVVTTSGLGTNYKEIEELLTGLLPAVKERKIELLLYASTHRDFRKMYLDKAAENGLSAGDENAKTQVRVIWDESIVTANQKLIEHAFGWADGFITKPSGDMAYDAAAAGCFLLTLSPWGEWEENIFDIFTRLGIAKAADINNFVEQLDSLEQENWFSRAINNALNIDDIFLNGAKNIVNLQQKL
ncbi:MAG: hypothetical protein A3A58_01270 [Candidatus Blackburnbacteria bacterium RIFCSPLOWO2_01_FULL_41_27]|uniref:Glycosyl transferase family 1 domain-containing protein n=1 Tax=Candidatus Blackburnbacteria bacterium RIFCSPLOWO2_01_FULL_41_27 TaxID=1797520 RepID=A0A1G1VD53_9BACT|nr:MAG: hypothetical protein A3A58_01270 [Candidatus Blackburnbacteria bacterium RIFCSPLOWO2_01_FULL_41_27]